MLLGVEDTHGTLDVPKVVPLNFDQQSHNTPQFSVRGNHDDLVDSSDRD